MVSGRNKAYTNMPAKEDSARDTSEFTAQVTMTGSRPAKFSECGEFLTESGKRIPLENITDTLFDCENGLQTPVLIECFHEKTLQNKQYAAVDIGGQDLAGHVRLVLQWAKGSKKKTFVVYNPHERTVETMEYRNKRTVMPSKEK